MGFSDDMAKFMRKAEVNVDQVVQNTVKDIGTKLVERTPVRDGVARANWKAEVGGYSPAFTDAGDKDGSGAIANIAAVAKGVKAGDAVYVTNSAPHIMSLEHGHSDQAPHGMKAITAAEGPAIVANAVRKATEGK